MASKKPETLFGEKVDTWLEHTYGHDVWIENIQQVSIRGTPDRLICIRGDFMAIELKSSGGKESRLQTYKLNAISRAGGRSFTLYPDGFDYFKEKMLELYPPLIKPN